MSFALDKMSLFISNDLFLMRNEPTRMRKDPSLMEMMRFPWETIFCA
jgi:hypothetical protein